MTDCNASGQLEEDPILRVANDLAAALHRCAAFLPLFVEAGPRLNRALAAHAEVDAALDAYCALMDIRRVDLNRST